MICKECGTDQDVEQYVYPALDDGPREVTQLCAEHAAQTGFCPGCGFFVEGNERDTISLHRYGFCVECFDDLRIEAGEVWDDDPDAIDYFDM